MFDEAPNEKVPEQPQLPPFLLRDENAGAQQLPPTVTFPSLFTSSPEPLGPSLPPTSQMMPSIRRPWSNRLKRIKHGRRLWRGSSLPKVMRFDLFLVTILIEGERFLWLHNVYHISFKSNKKRRQSGNMLENPCLFSPFDDKEACGTLPGEFVGYQALRYVNI